MKPQKYTVYAEHGYDCYLMSEDLKERKYIETDKVVLAFDVEALIAKLKCCYNCKHNYDSDEDNCVGCTAKDLKKWEMKE